MSTPSSPFEVHIDITNSDATAIDLLAAKIDISRSHIKRAMTKGAVWFTRGKNTQRVRRAKKTFNKGDSLHLYYNEEVLERIPPTPELIADEISYSVWYKPYGMLSQGSKWSDHCTISRWAEQHLTPQRPAFIVHRLDRAATGLILVAHEKRTAAALSELFQSRNIEKSYQAIVHGKFPEAKQTLDGDIEDKKAVSHVNIIKYDDVTNRSLVEIKIETGRKHQIRRHLSEFGFPIVGDRLYGDEKKNDEHEDLQLTAFTLVFQCPTTGEQRKYQLHDDKLPHLSSLTKP